MVLLLSSHRRSEIEILCDILETCLGGAAKTSVVYRSNLNFTRLDKYMNTLLGMGYISLSIVCMEGRKSEMKIVYNTTQQGKSFLANFVNMRQGLEKLISGNRVLARPLISRSL
jgi:predicted transcriptional regulator